MWRVGRLSCTLFVLIVFFVGHVWALRCWHRVWSCGWGRKLCACTCPTTHLDLGGDSDWCGGSGVLRCVYCIQYHCEKAKNREHHGIYCIVFVFFIFILNLDS